MKQVMFLLDKHRKDIWIDGDDDVWFYAGHWQVIEPTRTGFYSSNTGGEDDHKPTSRYGPYKRIYKGAR